MNTREKLYKKALTLFSENGYDYTSVSQIADAMKLSKASLYHYMSSKQHLLFLIYRDFLEKHFIPIFDKAEEMSDPKERIGYIIYSLTMLAATQPSAGILIQENRRLDAKYKQETEKVWARAYQLIRDTIKELQSSTCARKCNSAFSAFALLGMTSFTFYWFDYKRKESAEELAKTLSDIYLKGLLTGSGQ